jgi:SAM-dependent methyltransferase
VSEVTRVVVQPEEDPADPLVDLLAESMDAPLELVPHLPALLQDLEDLGARADDVVAILRERGLGPGSRALDLGCGKGAAAIATAQAFGGVVHGVDGMPEFVEHARARARAAGVGDRCDFRVADVRNVVGSEAGYDLVMLLALGSVFGDAAETVGTLRRCVRPGGLVLIDDAYVAEGAAVPEGAEGLHDRATTLQLLEAHGDRVIAERVMDTAENEAWCRAMTAQIVGRARELAAQHPDLADALLEFADRQRAETEILSGPVVGAMWLIEVRRA